MKKVFMSLLIILMGLFTPILAYAEGTGSTYNLKEKYQNRYSIDSGCKILVGVDGIAVDSKGNIYISNMTFDRVQVYYNNKFLYSYMVDKSINSSGSLFIRIDQNDNLYLSFVRTNIGFKFNNKQLVEAVDNYNNYPGYPRSNLRILNKCNDVYGNSYQLQSKFGYNYITKTSPDGQTSTVYSIPLSHYLLKLSIGIILILFFITVSFFGVKVYKIFRLKD